MSKKEEEEELEELRRRRRLLIVLVLSVIGFAYTNFRPAYHPVVSDKLMCQARLKAAQVAIRNYVKKNNHPPMSLTDIVQTLQSSKAVMGAFVPAGAHPIPDAVAYDFDGLKYTLKVYDENIKLVQKKGEVIILVAP